LGIHVAVGEAVVARRDDARARLAIHERVHARAHDAAGAAVAHVGAGGLLAAVLRIVVAVAEAGVALGHHAHAGDAAGHAVLRRRAGHTAHGAVPGVGLRVGLAAVDGIPVAVAE